MKKVLSAICALLLLCSLTACGKSEAVKGVEAQIAALETITVDSKSAIDAAESGYNALSDEEKNKVGNLKKLDEAKEVYRRLLVSAVEAKIAAIGSVTADSKSVIDAAEASFLALSAEDQASVSNADDLQKAKEAYSNAVAASVDEMIASIDMDADDREVQAQAARLAYEALTAEQQSKITNYDLLVEAEVPPVKTETDYARIEGIYVDDSYKKDGSSDVKLIVFYKAFTNSENIKVCGKSSEITFEGNNTYSSEHYHNVAQYCHNYVNGDYIKEVKFGEEKGVIAAFDIPAAELNAGREMTFELYGIPDTDKLKVKTDDIIHCASAEEVAKTANPEGYADEMQKREPADAETVARVKNAVNGYYWTASIDKISYRLEYFDSTYSLRCSIAGSSITAEGVYEVTKGYIKNTVNGTGAINYVPYSWADDGDISLKVADGYDVREN